ncbi:helix-turn-helix domain-containing protein [Monoglobus pectinilyticus]|uniref:helix-turn-helix domain-containing protein n=1 Tax=Monoglobus pectinilyticus TaxID=1981510 RepID=UPI003AB2B34B
MDILERLNKVLKEAGITRYRLSKKCDVPEETLTGIFNRGSVPTIVTLEAICKGLNITLSQFFAENDMIELTPELKELYSDWRFLTPKQKELTKQFVKEMKNK